VLDFDFTKKTSLCDKNWLKLHIFYREAYIPDRLYIIIMYISFYWLKNQILTQNANVLTFLFYRKTLVYGKN
jgi:hypothetical protein